jgi:hypothetical protein
MTRFTVVLDESGSPYFPYTEQDRYFSVGLLCPEDPDRIRSLILKGRSDCPDARVKRRGFFHASEDGRKTREFLVQRLHGNTFYFKMLLADKRAADAFHKVNKPRHLHRILLRELFNIGIADRCREIELLVGLQKQTLKSPKIIQDILDYHATVQIIEAINFPYGSTVRTKVDTVRMVNQIEEPLMDVVDYLIWAHQRAELKDDEHTHLQLPASMMRSSVGGAHRFPGIWRIFTQSTWSPDDPILRRKIFPFLEAPEESRLLEKVMEALQASIQPDQESQPLKIACDLGAKLIAGDSSTDTLLDFGESFFEVLDTEGIILYVSEREFCALKIGAAICCWLRKKKMHKPPIDGWEKILEEFATRLMGKEARVSSS